MRRKRKIREPRQVPWWPGWRLERAIAGGVILERCGWIGW